MSTTNDDRADFAQEAIDTFQAACGTDDEDAISDLICNLMHLANRTGEGAWNALERALGHYVAETLDPPDGMLNFKVSVEIPVVVMPQKAA